MNDEHRIDYDQHRNLRKVRTVLVVLGLLYVVLLAGDWFMRFYWFNWQEVFTSAAPAGAPAAHPEARPAFTEKHLPPRRGGDLSGLIGLAAVRARFEQERPAAVITLDPDGYRNIPYAPGQPFDVVVVGDSYMAEGIPLTNLISARLSRQLDRPVLNRAIQGRGPFQSIMRLLQGYEGGGHAPRWMVWGFIEREISGPAFSGFVYQLEARPDKKTAAAPSGFPWGQLAPSMLRKSLPNSSALAQFSRKSWNLLEYALTGQLPGDVFMFAAAPEEGPPMLGYGEALKSMYWTPEERNLDQAVWAVGYIRDYLARFGIRLLVVPIPDKEQVYRDRIPRQAWLNGREPYPSVIPEFLAKLRAAGIPGVDLFTPFQEASRQGVELYWRDDTHWRDEAIRLAADRIAAELAIAP